MEQTEIQEIKNRFSFLMENALSERQENLQEVENLLQEYPYCQPLHVLRAASSVDNPFSERHLSQASLYAANRGLLYQIIHHPETVAEKFAAASTGISDTPDETVLEESIPQVLTEEPIDAGEVFMVDFEESTDEKTTEPEEASLIETVIPDQEQPKMVDVQQLLQEETEEFEKDEREQDEPEPVQPAASESPIFDTVASSDYFTFDRSSADPLLNTGNQEQPAGEESESAAIEASFLTEEKTETSGSESVSKYNDDKLPYTFLWWLQKTRREHASTYQPYTSSQFVPSSSLKKNASPELNQQIIENIFHLQVPLNEDDAENEKPPVHTVEFQLKKQKDESLIEKFIKEEPQIQPPKPEKIDTENKARRSSEDNYDLVSETLAEIYIDQMLYHKAIDTYRKLSLKFPDKKLYFAGRIQELQNKIN